MCGDFNADLEVEDAGGAFRALLERGFADELGGTTEARWPTQFVSTSRFFFMRLDYIFVSASLKTCIVENSGRVLSENAPRGDHVPVEVTLAL